MLTTIPVKTSEIFWNPSQLKDKQHQLRLTGRLANTPCKVFAIAIAKADPT